MKKSNYLLKLALCFGAVVLLKTSMVETEKIANAEIGGWLGGTAASNQGLGVAGQMVGGYAGGEAGAAVGSVAGQWIGGAIGSLGGPAGTVLGVWAGGIAGGVAGAM